MSVIVNLFKQVFSRPFHIILAIIVGFLFFMSNLWLVNSGYLSFVISSDLLSIGSRLKLIFNIPDLIGINFGALDLSLSIAIAILLGINMSALWYYFQKQMTISRELSSSLFGAVISSLGIGCASCGSVVITSIFGIGASGAFVGFLPLGGNEFGFIGIIILLYSIYTIAKKINNNFVCEIK